MNQLPAGLAEPLHLVNPYPYGKALAFLAALLLLALLWAWWRRRRRSAPSSPAAAPPPIPPPPPASTIEKAIAEIRLRYVETRRHREGCHELAEVLRTYYEKACGKPLSRLTVREIGTVLGDSAVTALFELLAEMQFRRRQPSSDEFSQICETATDVAKSGVV